MENFNFYFNYAITYLKKILNMKKQLKLIMPAIVMVMVCLTSYSQQVGEQITTADSIKYEITDILGPGFAIAEVVDYTGSAREVDINFFLLYKRTYIEVRAIGDEAFKGKALTRVDIPNIVRTIGREAFRDNDLTKVIIPDFASTIGASAFQDNPLETVIVRRHTPPSLGPGAFSNPNQIHLLVPESNITDYSTNNSWAAFQPIDPGTFSVGDFRYGITSPSSNEVEILGYTGTSKQVTIPQTVRDQGTDTEYKVTAIGHKVFEKDSLTAVDFGPSSNVARIGVDAFWQNQLTSLDIPESVTSIRQRAFGANNRLAELNLANGVKKIEMWAFSAAVDLEELVIPATVESIGFQAFLGADSLTKVTVERIPPTTVDPTAFAHDGGIVFKELVVPFGQIQGYKNAGWANEAQGFRFITSGMTIIDDVAYAITTSQTGASLIAASLWYTSMVYHSRNGGD